MLRIAIALVAAVWGGAVAFFPVVAQVAFHTLTVGPVFGLLIRNILLTLNNEGLALGSLLLVLLLAAARLRVYPRRLLGPILCAAAMLGLTAFLQWNIMPRMEVDRLALHGDVPAAPPDDPHRAEFDRLHQASVRVDGGVLVAGLAMLGLLARGEKPASRGSGVPVVGRTCELL